MSNVSEWSTTAGSNNSAAPDGAPEGMLAGKVNDVMREMMAALAKVYQDQRGSLTSAGSSNAYTLTTNNAHAALSDLPMIVFDANHENTGTATLAVDGLAAKTIYKAGGLHPLVAGDIKEGQMVCLIYNPTDDHFEMLNNTPTGAAPKGHLWGMQMSLDTDTAHDINVTAGECADQNGEDLLVLSSEITKQIDSAWAVGDDAGGLDTGTVAADTTYHIHCIKRSDTGVTDVLFSTSATAPTLPTNYDRSRRIGSIVTDVSANIIPFWQSGDTFIWQTSQTDYTSTADRANALITLTVPGGIKVAPVCGMEGGEGTFRLYDARDTGFTNAFKAGTNSSLGNPRDTVGPSLYTNTSAQVGFGCNGDGALMTLVTNAWVDERDKYGTL